MAARVSLMNRDSAELSGRRKGVRDVLAGEVFRKSFFADGAEA